MGHNLFISNFSMSKPFIRLIKKGTFLLVLILCLDRTIGSVIQYYLKKEKQGDSSVTTYALTKASEDVIIFGSSRAAHHYIPTIIQEKTSLTTLNVGRDGMTLAYYTALLKGILAHHKPRIVILDLNLNDFQSVNNKENPMVTALLPYIGENEIIRQIVKEKRPVKFWCAEISLLYRVNSLPAPILQHNLGIGQKHSNGYEALVGNKLKSISDTLEENTDYREDPELIKRFEEFITILQKRSVKLYVLVSPSAKKSKFDSKETAAKTLAKYGLKLYDYSDFPGPDRLALFYDGTHLNDSGAKLYTLTLVKDLINN